MRKKKILGKKVSNSLLAALSKSSYEHFSEKLERTELKFGDKLYQIGDVIQDVYFPENGLVSLLAAAEERSTLEVGMIGNEGMVGISVFLGVSKSSNIATVQGNGTALRMSAIEFIAECKFSEELSSILGRFTNSFMVQISQSAVCYRFHAIESRLARWLLMTSDAMQSDDYRITQEFLSNMLGVRREGVNKAALNLQKQGIIKYSRGKIAILERKKLLEKTCICYTLIKNSFEAAPS
jgi:CRP-like cAMP-binding protein